MELGALGGRRIGFGRGSRRRWRGGREDDKIDQNGKADKKRPREKSPFPSLPSGLKRSPSETTQFLKLTILHS